MKRKMAMLLCAAMMVGAVGGCGGSSDSEPQTFTEDTTTTTQTTTETAEETDEETPEAADVETQNVQSQAKVLEDVSYVMIYNPYIYDEEGANGMPVTASMYTGDFSDQIVTGMNRAGGLSDDFELPAVISQAEINKDTDISVANLQGVRAEGADPSYELYDTHDFFRRDNALSSIYKSTFQCLYEGENCYVWACDDSVSEADAQTMGGEFDALIYETDIEAFGTARFTDNGGKINILIYPFTENVGGFFARSDIFSSAEISPDDAETYGFNTDHAIIHINSYYTTVKPSFAKSTLAHELQHLICATDRFGYMYTPFMQSWINEAMSAYAEEINYPGIKEAGYYNEYFYVSDLYRKGQSIYNFNVENDQYIGAYGVVYLFSEYLTQLAGEDVFTEVHSYWRNCYSADVTEAETLVQAVPDEVYNEINNKYTYSSEVSRGFVTSDEEWMSKLTLDFYIETLSMELANLVEVEDQAHALMLYSEINPLEIEGGGRVIVAVQNDAYEIPADADANLIYVGLDENFEPKVIY